VTTVARKSTAGKAHGLPRKKALEIAQQIAQGPAFVLEPIEEDAHVPAHAEVPHAQVEIGLGLARMRDLGAGRDAHAQRGLDDVTLGLDDSGVAPLSREPDAHRVVGGPELDHVDALHRQHRLQVLHRGGLLDHHRHHRVVERLDERGRAHVHDVADIAAHAHPVETARLGCLGPHAPHAVAHVVGRARIGEEQVLDPRADGAHRQVGARLLLDLEHGGHVVERVHGPREVLEREEIVGRVLAHELHVVEEAGVTGQLHHRRPRRVDVSAHRGLARPQQFPESIASHAPSLGAQVRPVNHRVPGAVEGHVAVLHLVQEPDALPAEDGYEDEAALQGHGPEHSP